jgi:hypothetical protein
MVSFRRAWRRLNRLPWDRPRRRMNCLVIVRVLAPWLLLRRRRPAALSRNRTVVWAEAVGVAEDEEAVHTLGAAATPLACSSPVLLFLQ